MIDIPLKSTIDKYSTTTTALPSACDMAPAKTCASCHQLKPLDQFYWGFSKTKGKYRVSRCIICARKFAIEKYYRKKERKAAIAAGIPIPPPAPRPPKLTYGVVSFPEPIKVLPPPDWRTYESCKHSICNGHSMPQNKTDWFWNTLTNAVLDKYPTLLPPELERAKEYRDKYNEKCVSN